MNLAEWLRQRVPRRGEREAGPAEVAGPVQAAGPIHAADPVISGRARSDEDARIMRHTRLRLMIVSGVVTLLILAVLGGATYAVTANALASDSINRLHFVAADMISPGTLGPPTEYDMAFGGPRAGIVGLVVAPDGTIVNHPRSVPVGLPDLTAVKVALAGASDLRTEVVPVGPIRVYTTPVRDSTGTVIGVVQTCVNMTDEINLLHTLLWVLLLGGAGAMLASLVAGYLYAGRALVPIRQSIDRRQAALQRQREFAANASHELRTPLTVIGASVEDLKRNRRSRVEDVGDALSDIDAEVRHMTALVQDMLLLARTDSGVVQIERVPIDLSDIAAEATSVLSAFGNERRVNVVLDPLPAPMAGDPLRLRQLVTILVDNAIRHSPAGSSVEVWVRPDKGTAILQVDDHGTGIKPEDLPRLFERFWRADDAPAGGTGLGLAIARWIVDQHAGTIAAANRPEGGASFRVVLPVVAAPAEAPAPDATASWLGAPESIARGDAPPPATEPSSWARRDSET